MALAVAFMFITGAIVVDKRVFKSDVFLNGPWHINDTEVTSTADELNIMDGVTATTSEINKLDESANGALMSAGSGLTDATGFVHKMGIERFGDIITTRIYMDITGLNSGGAADDIIGKDGGTANCHFG